MLLLYTFLTIYNPPLLPISFLHITTIVAIIDFLSRRESYRKHFKGKITNLWFGILCVLGYLFLVIYANGKNLVDPIYRIAVISFEMIPCSCYIAYHANRKGKNLLELVIQAASIEACICIITLLFPPIQSMLISRMVSNGYSESYSRFVSYRLYGISYSMMFGMPILNSVLSVVALYKSITKKIVYIIPAVALALTAVLNARISIATFMISIVFMLIILLRDHQGIAKKIKKLLPISIVIIVASWFILKALGGQYARTIEWIEKGFIDMIAIIFGDDNGGKYYSYYRGAQKWQLPEGFINCVFGTGQRVVRGNTQYSSDIGYINDIWLGGFVYAIALYFIFSKMIIDIGKKIEQILGVKLIGIAIISIVAVANVKGGVIGNNEFIAFLILLFCYYNSAIPTQMKLDTNT